MKKPAGKPFVPVPVAVQQQQHRKALRALRHFTPVPAGAQRRQHARAVKAAQHAKTAKKVKPRKWSPDESVPCCSARAVAEAVRITSGTILSDDDVLAIYWSAASDGDAGITILDALTAAEDLFPGPAVSTYAPRLTGSTVPIRSRAADLVILGLDLPYGEPHAVVQHDGAWWSWGQPWSPDDFPGAIIEEAWAVQWRP